MRVKGIASVLAMVLVMAGSIWYLGVAGFSVTDNVGVHRATMKVSHTNGLVIGSRVLFNGVAIGKVTAIHAGADAVRVDWNYKQRYRIPQSATYRIDNLSALGEAYVGISDEGRTSETWIPDGAVVNAAATTVPTGIDEFSARFTRLVNQIDSHYIQGIVSTMNQGLIGDQTVINNLAKAGALLEATIMSTRSDFEQLLDRWQPLLSRGASISDSLQASGGPLGQFGLRMGDFLTHAANYIEVADAPHKLFDGVGPVLARVQSFLDTSSPDIQVLASTALPFVSSTASTLKTVDARNLFLMALKTSGSGNGLVVHVGGGPR